MVERMLKKGDRIRYKYEGFDFKSLDKNQQFWLGKLSYFSKYRDRIISRYNNGSTISTDLKIMYLDQHSMRIGTTIFYNLESSRQKYMLALENYPLIAGVLAVGFWIGFAYRTPIYSKLYKEMGYSIVLGTGVSYSYAYFHYLKYLNVVDESYNIVRMRFAQNPQIVERENPDNSPN